MIPALDTTYWNNRYLENNSGWDIGCISTPIKAYIDQLTSKNIRILIPGAGNSYEAEYLHQLGFTNVFVCDIAQEPLKNLKSRCNTFPDKHLLLTDFFELHQPFDLIIEQTFFCALNPNLRTAYFKKMSELLSQNGQLIGLLFNDALNQTHPPFGGSAEEYKKLAEPFLHIEKMETCYNSITPRANRELFIKMKRHAST